MHSMWVNDTWLMLAQRMWNESFSGNSSNKLKTRKMRGAKLYWPNFANCLPLHTWRRTGVGFWKVDTWSQPKQKPFANWSINSAGTFARRRYRWLTRSKFQRTVYLLRSRGSKVSIVNEESRGLIWQLVFGKRKLVADFPLNSLTANTDPQPFFVPKAFYEGKSGLI